MRVLQVSHTRTDIPELAGYIILTDRGRIVPHNIQPEGVDYLYSVTVHLDVMGHELEYTAIEDPEAWFMLIPDRFSSSYTFIKEIDPQQMTAERRHELAQIVDSLDERDQETRDMVGGRQRDSQFARGFLSCLNTSGTQIVRTGDQMYRSVVTLEPPMGRIEGDVAVVISDDESPGATLVIIEREGSGPGNERNLLKWYAALRQHNNISLRRNGNDLEIQWSRMLVLLAFGRSESWDRTDYDKTVAFCSELARLLNEIAVTEHLPGEFKIQSSQNPVNDWESEGRRHAEQLLTSLTD